jgi:Flp pilus assembly protein TadD
MRPTEADLAGKTTPFALRTARRLLAPTAVILALVVPAPSAPGTARAEGTSGIAGPYLAAEAAAKRGDVANAARFYAEALAHDTANIGLMQRTLTYEIAAGRIEQAVPVARRLEGLHPGHPLGALLLAAEALKRGEPARARDVLAADDDQETPFVGRLMGVWASYELGDIGAARAQLSDLESGGEAGDAGEILSAYHLGLLEAAAGRDAEAIVALDRITELGGATTLRLARIRAGVLARLGRIEEARATVAERLAQTLGDRRLESLARDLDAGRIPPPVVRTGLEGAAEALYGIAGYLARGTNRNIGLAYARLATYLDPEHIEAQLLIAGMLQQDEQYDLTIAVLEAIPDDAPEALEAQIARAEAMHESGRVDEAIDALRLTVAAHPRSIEARTALGDMLRREERFAEAAEAYDGAVALVANPERRHWPLFYQRGIAYERSQQWDRAEADFHKALELEPDQPLVLNYLGYSWVEMRHNLAEAQAMIERAVEQRPTDGYIVDSLGWVLYRLSDFEGAAAKLEKAVELKPVDPVINDHFGDALWMIGRRTEARFQWKRALSFEPEEEDAERIRRKLEIGLDAVLKEEAAAGNPAFIQIDGAADGAAGGDKANDGG